MSQQIYIPLGDKYPIPYEFETDTLPVPRGQYSVLWELRDGNLTAAEALMYLCLNHGSTWQSGATWPMSSHNVSKILGTGMSRSYVVKLLASLAEKDWIQTIDADNPSGKRYKLRHHLCPYQDVPVNKDGKPLMFAVPRGPGGPLERCFDGDISWKAALVWIVLKLRSNWKAHADTAGQTEQATLLELSKRCRIKLATFQTILTELTEAGMLERMSPKSQPAIFQLYPKPFPKLTKPEPEPIRPVEKAWLNGKSLNTDGEEYWYSHNLQYRCPLDDYMEIERRQRDGTWKRVSEYHRVQVMPKSIVNDFERFVVHHCGIMRQLQRKD